MLTFEKEVIPILSSFYLIGKPRDPIERIWTFVCPFFLGGGGRGRVRGAIYLIIPNQQSSNTSPGLIVRKDKEGQINP